jgi:hypothetical protein
MTMRPKQPAVHSDPIANAVNVMCGQLLERRGLAAADFIRDRLPDSLLMSQRVSIARALRPYVQAAAKARQASTGTGPGLCQARKHAPLHTIPFIARCVGIAPKTLRLAIEVVEFIEADPRYRCRLFQLDHGGKLRAFQGVAGAHKALFGGVGEALVVGVADDYQPSPGTAFGTEFGAQLLRDLSGNKPTVPKAFGTGASKRKGHARDMSQATGKLQEGSKAFGHTGARKGKDRTCSVE